MKIPILSNLLNPIYVLIALAVSLTFFSLNFALMARLPGEVNNMCVMGGGLNASNLSFTIVLSILLGIFAAGFYALFAKESPKKNTALTAVSGAGFTLGPLTIFCTLCTLPAISLFGISTIMSFLSHYSQIIQIASIGIVTLGLFLLNRQLSEHCDRCVT